jgi:drug/metabolite transporter (DMT)-like permease
MATDVFVLVLCAAFVHAAWNAVVKAGDDRLSLIKIMSGTQFVLSLVLLPFVPVPPMSAWPYLIASAFVNIGYMMFLTQAYRTGDLSHAYPLSRGIAPLLVAAISMFLLGEQLSLASQIAILLIGGGITSLSLTRGVEGLRDLRMVGFALGTGGFIAVYTILDGLGARAAGSAGAYVVWVSLVGAILMVSAVHRLQRSSRKPISRWTLKAGIATGLTSYVSAWIVIWAMTEAPIPLVSGLRETSIIFAVAIGIVFFKERLNLARLASIMTTLVGTTILKLSR